MKTAKYATAVALGLIGFFGAALGAKADTITFNDTTDTITFTQVGSQLSITPASCSSVEPALCQIVITSNSSTTPITPTMSLNISEAGLNPTVAVSDWLLAQQGTTGYVVTFASDPAGDTALGLTPLTSANAGGSRPGTLSEDGTVQTAFILKWSDGSSATIQFQSGLDAPAVPEPGSLILLGSGLLGLAGYVRRRKAPGTQ